MCCISLTIIQKLTSGNWILCANDPSWNFHSAGQSCYSHSHTDWKKRGSRSLPTMYNINIVEILTRVDCYRRPVNYLEHEHPPNLSIYDILWLMTLWHYDLTSTKYSLCTCWERDRKYRDTSSYSPYWSNIPISRVSSSSTVLTRSLLTGVFAYQINDRSYL